MLIMVSFENLGIRVLGSNLFFPQQATSTNLQNISKDV